MNAENSDQKSNIIERARDLNQKVDYYWRKGVLWFWGILALLIILTLCDALFNAIGL